MQSEFEYHPNQMEGIFQLTQSAQEIRKILIEASEKKEQAEKQKVQANEIQEIVAVSDMGEYALLKIKKDFREAKYSNHSYVAVCLKLKPRMT
jgi:hypothetical protein